MGVESDGKCSGNGPLAELEFFIVGADQRPLFHHFSLHDSPLTANPIARFQEQPTAECRPWKLVSAAIPMEHPSFRSCSSIRCRLEMRRALIFAEARGARQRGIVSVDLGADEATRRPRRGFKRRGTASPLIRTPPVRSGAIRDSVIALGGWCCQDRTEAVDGDKQSHTFSSVSRHMHDAAYPSDVYLDLDVFWMY
jgi:hypothetical protein